MDFNSFPCVPPCKACRVAGLCSQPMAESFAPDETVQARKRGDPHAGIVVLPCGCWGLPWPLVHKLGDSFDEIFCDRHGWMKVTASGKKRMKKDAENIYKKETQPTLDEVVPYLWQTSRFIRCAYGYANADISLSAIACTGQGKSITARNAANG